MIIYLGNLSRKLLEIMTEFDRDAGYEINIKKKFYASSGHLEIEI